MYLSVSTNDIRNARVVSDYTLLIADTLLCFASSSALYTALYYVSLQMTDPFSLAKNGGEDQTMIDMYIYDDLLVTKDTAYNGEEGVSLETVLRASIDHILDSKDSEYWGQMAKIVGDNDPLFYIDAYSMQDALYYAIGDHSYTNLDDLYDQYVMHLGYAWWFVFFDPETIHDLTKYFFDKCIQMVNAS